MKSQATMWAFSCSPSVHARWGTSGGEPAYNESAQQRFLQRMHPVGGWHPYGGGLLHWWNPHCFPRQGAPDDYCRKPLPRVCWPPYPPYYVWGPPEINLNHPPGTHLER